jgi:hypothetical protein
MKDAIDIDTDKIGNKTFQVVENSILRDLTFGDITNKKTKILLERKLGNNLDANTVIRFSAGALSPFEENNLFNELIKEFNNL